MASWEKKKELTHLHAPEDNPLADLSILLDMDEMDPNDSKDDNPGASKFAEQLEARPGPSNEKTYQLGYKDKEDQRPDLKLRDWVPDPEHMSKYGTIRLILCGLYSAEKAQEILKYDFDVHWEKSPENPEYFEVQYKCRMCSSVINESMPIKYNEETGIWTKIGPLRGEMGSCVHGMKRHYKRCIASLPFSSSSTESVKPRIRANPVRRYREKLQQLASRPRRPRRKQASESGSNTTSSNPLAFVPGPCSPYTIQHPGCLHSGLPKPTIADPSLAVAMSGGPFWEQVYYDSIFGSPSGSGDN
uniref:Tas n=1 Tax=Simian foamy virus TaxID=11642 RepID=A0A3S9W1K9_9RETR|nr:Tas [Simian foamy virus]